jgi:hypothetical protein
MEIRRRAQVGTSNGLGHKGTKILNEATDDIPLSPTYLHHAPLPFQVRWL